MAQSTRKKSSRKKKTSGTGAAKSNRSASKSDVVQTADHEDAMLNDSSTDLNESVTASMSAGRVGQETLSPAPQTMANPANFENHKNDDGMDMSRLSNAERAAFANRYPMQTSAVEQKASAMDALKSAPALQTLKSKAQNFEKFVTDKPMMSSLLAAGAIFATLWYMGRPKQSSAR